MPPPAAVLVPGALVAAKHVAVQAARYATSATFTSTTFGLIVARLVWKKIPPWIKKDISFRNLFLRTNKYNNDDDAIDDLSNLSSVLQKWNDLVQSVVPLDEEQKDEGPSSLTAVMLAYIQLSGQLKQRIQQPTKKNRRRHSNVCCTITTTPTDEQEDDDECPYFSTRNIRDELYHSAGQIVEWGDETDAADAELTSVSSQSSSLSSSSVPPRRVSSHHQNGAPYSSMRIKDKDEISRALDFATWAYYEDSEVLQERLEARGFTLIEQSLDKWKQKNHDATQEYELLPGTVTYYIAVSSDPVDDKTMLIGVRGTSTLEELLTDCCGRAIPLQPKSAAEDDPFSLRIEVKASKSNEIVEGDNGEDMEVLPGHGEKVTVEDHDDEGDRFVRCHEGMTISTRRMVEDIEPLIKNWGVRQNYKVVLCGHSLGAGAAAVAGLLLRDQFPTLREENRLQVYAIAPPPIVDHDTAVASASFCLSIVNNADIVPRCSLSNLAVFLELLRKVHLKLKEKKINPTGPMSTAAFLSHLQQGLEAEPLLDNDEHASALKEAQERVALRQKQHLFIPGRVLLLFEPWEQEGDEESNLESSTPSIQCVETTGVAPVFQSVEVDGLRLFSDHVTTSYYKALGIEYVY